MTSHKSFIYISKPCGRVILVKYAQGSDFNFVSRDFETIEISAPTRFPKVDAFSQRYSFEGGLIPAPIDNERDSEIIAKMRFLRHKVDVLIRMKTAVLYMSMGISDKYSDQRIRTFPISDKSFRSYWELAREEHRILEGRIEALWLEFAERVERAQTIAEIDSEYLRTKENVALGLLLVRKVDDDELAAD